MNLANEHLIEEYLSRPYGRVLSREPDGRYSAYVLEWPGCYGEGDTAEEANRSLEESMAAWVDVMLEDGESIPEPLAREYSGRLLVRLSRDAHRRAAIRAQAEGVSVNSLIGSYIDAGLAGGEHRRAELPTRAGVR
jgi:predicted RNase H-like HicB family nuclease